MVRSDCAAKKAMLRSDDPHQLALGLKREHVIRIQQIVLGAGSSHDSTAFGCTSVFGGGGDLRYVLGNLERFIPQLFGALNRFLQSGVADWFQQIVDRSGFKRLHGVLIECRDDDDDWKCSAFEIAHYFEPPHDGHLQIQEDQFGFELCDLLECIAAILGFADYGYVWNKLQFLAQNSPCDGFVIDDQRLHAWATYLSSIPYGGSKT